MRKSGNWFSFKYHVIFMWRVRGQVRAHPVSITNASFNLLWEGHVSKQIQSGPVSSLAYFWEQKSTLWFLPNSVSICREVNVIYSILQKLTRQADFFFKWNSISNVNYLKQPLKAPKSYIRELEHDVYGRRQTANGKDYLWFSIFSCNP